jgi:hypothetical protein
MTQRRNWFRIFAELTAQEQGNVGGPPPSPDLALQLTVMSEEARILREQIEQLDRDIRELQQKALHGDRSLSSSVSVR